MPFAVTQRILANERAPIPKTKFCTFNTLMCYFWRGLDTFSGYIVLAILSIILKLCICCHVQVRPPQDFPYKIWNRRWTWLQSWDFMVSLLGWMWPTSFRWGSAAPPRFPGRLKHKDESHPQGSFLHLGTAVGKSHLSKAEEPPECSICLKQQAQEGTCARSRNVERPEGHEGLRNVLVPAHTGYSLREIMWPVGSGWTFWNCLTNRLLVEQGLTLPGNTHSPLAAPASGWTTQGSVPIFVSCVWFLLISVGPQSCKHMLLQHLYFRLTPGIDSWSSPSSTLPSERSRQNEVLIMGPPLLKPLVGPWSYPAWCYNNGCMSYICLSP